jgi:cobyrinic acid a,c-diamide synthase
MVERSIDLDAVMALAEPLEPQVGDFTAALPPPGQRIALAQDTAFTFVYPHAAARWHAAGAEIMPFSPLADEPPPPACDTCWLPGGYPELHAGKLAAAGRFRSGMQKFAATKPIHGECGGFMVLGEALEDADGATHRMLGLLGHSTSFARRKMNLGYRQATLLADCPLGAAETAVRGHEFHYARITEPGNDAPLADMADGEGRPLGPAGARRGHVSGTFFHAIARG